MKRAMTVPWSLLWILALICSSDSGCSPTSYYKSCWIRRYPGLYVDIEESQRRGAHLLRVYQDESALKCSRACCLTPNFSCNLAVFHFNTTQDSVNCFHLRCPSAESCVPHRRGNVILYNVTKGVDPDLLVFGKHFTTNVRVLPHMSSSRLNVSEPLTSDKRQFNYPPVRSISTKKPTSPQQTTPAVPTTLEVQHNLPPCATTTLSTSEHTTSTTSLHPQQTTTTPQWESTKRHHITVTQTTSQTDEPDTLNHSIPNPSTTAHPSSTTEHLDSTLTSIPINDALTTQQPLGLQTTSLQTASQNTTQSFTETTSDEYLETTTVFQTFASSRSETLTNTTPLTSANVPLQTQPQISPEYETIQSTTAPENVISITSQLKMDSTLNPQQTTTTPQRTPTKPLQTSSQNPPAYETQTTVQSQPKLTISSDTRTANPTIPTDDSTTPRRLTFTHTRMGKSASSSPTSSTMDSQAYPNDTKGYISRNITTGDAPRPVGSLTSVWHLAANTVLVALATCATVTFCCCCSVFAALSWRGRRRRKRRYRTNLRGKRGSMRLIKYVIVRESS